MTKAQQIVRLKAEGLTNRAIAEKVGCGQEYVRVALMRAKAGGRRSCDYPRWDQRRRDADYMPQRGNRTPRIFRYVGKSA